MPSTGRCWSSGPRSTRGSGAGSKWGPGPQKPLTPAPLPQGVRGDSPRRLRRAQAADDVGAKLLQPAALSEHLGQAQALVIVRDVGVLLVAHPAGGAVDQREGLLDLHALGR